MPTYGKKYGWSIGERARRMANNIPPKGNDLPPVGYQGRGFRRAYFSENYRYIEDINRLSQEEMQSRTYVIVRSQKFNEYDKKGKRNRKIYFVKMEDDKSLYDTFYGRGFKVGSCTCVNWVENEKKCKHMEAVRIKYSKSLIKKLVF